MEQRHIAFLGAGNMARSLIAGLRAAQFPGSLIHATDPDAQKLAQLAGEFGIQVTQDNTAAARAAQVIVLAVKPQYMAQMLEQLTAELGSLEDRLVVSIAAGIKVARLSQLLGGHRKIVRCMPNTPALIGLGMTGLYAPGEVSDSDRAFAEAMLQAVGKTVWVGQETDINGVIAASGSAPAYFFLLMQHMAEEAVRLGFSEADARLLVQQTALGAAQMVIDNPATSLVTLREQVTSKGGTTAEAVRTFEEGKLDELVSRAMQAAIVRAEEMEQLF